MKIKGLDVLGRCTLCRHRRLVARDLGYDIWACSYCLRLIEAAAYAAHDPEPILFVGGPMAGATIGQRRGDPPPELYVVRGPQGTSSSLPTDRPPFGVPRDDLGWYAFDDGLLGAYRWQGWLDG